MQIRTPAVAGMFYPREANELKDVVKNCFLHSSPLKWAKVENTAMSA